MKKGDIVQHMGRIYDGGGNRLMKGELLYSEAQHTGSWRVRIIGLHWHQEEWWTARRFIVLSTAAETPPEYHEDI